MIAYLYWSGLDWPFHATICIDSLTRYGGFSDVCLCVDGALPDDALRGLDGRVRVVAPEDLFDAEALAIYARLGQSDWKAVVRSDFFSYYVLYRYGGYYFDVDAVVLRDFSSLQSVDSLVGREAPDVASVGIMYFRQGHPVLREVLDSIGTTNIVSFNQLGPKLLSRHFGRLCLAPVNMFYPWYYTQWRLPFSPASNNIAIDALINGGTYAVHLWGEMLRRERFAPNREFVASNPHCLFSRLVDRSL